MNVIAEIITHAESTELMEPTIRSLHHPAKHSQPTPVGRTPFGQLRIDPPVTQFLSLFLIIKAAVSHALVRASAGMARLATDEWYRIHQGHRLVGVRGVGRPNVDDQGDPLAVREHLVFTAQF